MQLPSLRRPLRLGWLMQTAERRPSLWVPFTFQPSFSYLSPSKHEDSDDCFAGDFAAKHGDSIWRHCSVSHVVLQRVCQNATVKRQEYLTRSRFTAIWSQCTSSRNNLSWARTKLLLSFKMLMFAAPMSLQSLISLAYVNRCSNSGNVWLCRRLTSLLGTSEWF